MEPRIQYTKTTDGVNIAYWAMGEGPVLIYTPHPTWGIALSGMQVPEVRAWYERLARHRTLVRYDSRGTGESDRHADDYSLDGLLRDLEAVAQAAGGDSFALFGYAFTGAVAIAYAVRHPERVSHLILWCALAEARHYWESSRTQAFSSLRAAAKEEWDLYVDTIANISFGEASGDLVRRLADAMRQSVSASEVDAIRAGQRMMDVTVLLPQVQVPTLVLHRRDIRAVPVEEGRLLAASIPGATLQTFPGSSAGPFVGDFERVATAVEDFLGVPSPSAALETASLRTILFTDLTSSTSLTQRLGDAQAQELVRAHDAIVREALRAHGGTEIKHTGDGIMASFGSASGALECAVAIQRGVQTRSDANLAVHVGLNAGEPVAEADDLFGTAVQLARRICDQASGGEILASDVVRQLAAGKGFLFADRGEVALRGFEDPVRLYEVRWRE
jgi:class 3 adenylate cyclase/pimeloyl-ACP methyl ester carboxylesterase